jgi:hypothetical protein
MWNLTVQAYEKAAFYEAYVILYWQESGKALFERRYDLKMNLPKPVLEGDYSRNEDIADAIMCKLMMGWEHESECRHTESKSCILVFRHDYKDPGAPQLELPN